MENRSLTKAEQQVMNYLWSIKRGFLKDIVDQFPAPRPAYTTLSTVIRVLVKKGFVGYQRHGKTHEYYPLIPKEKYSKFYLNNFLKGYFNGSFQNLVSFFAQEDKLNVKDIDALMKQLENLKNK